MLKRSSPRNCKMTFIKSENGPISWTELNILINFCVNFDIDKIQPKRLRNDIFYRSRLCRAPNSEKVKMAQSLELWRILWWNFAYTLILTRCSQWDCQIIFGIGRGFAKVQILKKWNWPYPLNLLVYFDKILHTHYYWHDLDRGIAKSIPRDCKMTFNIGPNSEKVKMAELSGLLWWNFAYTLILTRCSPRDCQMSFGIGRGVSEVQILKNSETGPISWNLLNILIKLCINIAIDMS